MNTPCVGLILYYLGIGIRLLFVQINLKPPWFSVLADSSLGQVPSFLPPSALHHANNVPTIQQSKRLLSCRNNQRTHCSPLVVSHIGIRSNYFAVLTLQSFLHSLQLNFVALHNSQLKALDETLNCKTAQVTSCRNRRSY